MRDTPIKIEPCPLVISAYALAAGSGRRRPAWRCHRALPAVLVGVLWIMVVLTACPPVALGENIHITVRPKARVAGDVIFLRDIAAVSAPDLLKGEIGNIRLTRAPRPGRDKKIPGRRIRSMLLAGKRLPAGARVVVPDSIRVTRTSQSIPETFLQQVFHRYIAGELSGSEFKISRFDVRGTNLFPEGKLALSVKRRSKRDIKGNVSLRVGVRVNGQECGRLTISGWVDRFARVVCTRRALPRHAVVSEADLILKAINISKAPDGLVKDLTQAVGKQVRTRIPADACLSARHLESPPLIQKGDRVRILATSGALNVSTLGVAKGSGGRGDQIRVVNVATSKTVTGRVTGLSTVEVLF